MFSHAARADLTSDPKKDDFSDILEPPLGAGNSDVNARVPTATAKSHGSRLVACDDLVDLKKLG